MTSLLLGLLGCGAAPIVAPPPPYFDDLPAYPGARLLCDTTQTLANGSLHTTAYATKDDPDTVNAFYRENHGKTVALPSGARMMYRGTQERMLAVGPPASQDYTCGVEPSPDERTSLVITRFTRTTELH